MKVVSSNLLELRSQIISRNAELQGVKKPSEAAGAGFGNALTQAIDSVKVTQAEAAQATDAFERGDSQDVAGMMLARQKSSLAFQATLQVRNKVLSAYKDVMNMPV